jgi:hypothetical protein
MPNGTDKHEKVQLLNPASRQPSCRTTVIGNQIASRCVPGIFEKTDIVSNNV